MGQTLTIGSRPLLTLASLNLAFALFLTGCDANAPTAAENLTDRVIHSIYAGDFEQTARAFDTRARAAMTRTSFEIVAKLMRSFGEYRFANQISALPNNRYDLEADFEDGSMLVQLRLNPDGKIAALHITPNVDRKKPGR